MKIFLTTCLYCCCFITTAQQKTYLKLNPIQPLFGETRIEYAVRKDFKGYGIGISYLSKGVFLQSDVFNYAGIKVIASYYLFNQENDGKSYMNVRLFYSNSFKQNLFYDQRCTVNDPGHWFCTDDRLGDYYYYHESKNVMGVKLIFGRHITKGHFLLDIYGGVSIRYRNRHEYIYQDASAIPQLAPRIEVKSNVMPSIQGGLNVGYVK